MTKLEEAQSLRDAFAAALGAQHATVRLLDAALAVRDEGVVATAVAYALARGPDEAKLIAGFRDEHIAEVQRSGVSLSLVLDVMPNRAPPARAGDPPFSWSDPRTFIVAPQWRYMPRLEHVRVILPDGPNAATQAASDWLRMSSREWLTVNSKEAVSRILLAKARAARQN